MKNLRGVAVASLLSVIAVPAFAFNLNDAVNAAGALNGSGSDNKAAAVQAAPGSAGLLNTLGTQLKVTPEQAVGGTGAMLGLAKNKMSSSQYSQLTKQVPGLDMLSGSNALSGSSGLSGLLGNSGNSAALSNAVGNVKTTSDMNNAFTSLGMNSSMVGQFAPVILQYLGQQGVGGTALKSLGSIWGAGG